MTKESTRPLDAAEDESITLDFTDEASLTFDSPVDAIPSVKSKPGGDAQPAPQKSQGAMNKRRWKRFTVEGACVLASKPSLMKLGKTVHCRVGPVKDIGMGGLAVQYMGDNKYLEKTKSLSIMLPGEGVIVEDIRFETVNDFETATLPDSRKQIRTACLCFKKLLPKQKMQLERFIDDHGFEIKRQTP